MSEEALLHATDRELDRLFRTSPVGELPAGPADGTALVAPGSGLTANLARLAAWHGVFSPDGQSLVTQLGPVRSMEAFVEPGPSWVDARECVVLDYSGTSLLARGVRGELRRVAPELCLGVMWLFRRRVGWFLLRMAG
ncbi:hypothetical protein FPZ12_040455 [Amycolatopsis acidicola]|uniref:Uncharacterized protein n=1 Tax=Amycolatopsis acidicola TaxID=2596893 RepID=A0A5N0UML5_9PSEU|nr:hypothetical protein FPZ12_040455 [Amycolatopsis acidicola]